MTIKIHYKAHSTVAVLAVALLAAPILASGARAADFYKGETIQIFVGFGAGGSYDGYSRLVARHLGRLIPGQPKIIVSNMPGAGGLKAANYLYKIAPQNGTALGVVAEAAALEQVLGAKGIRFDASKFNWIGRMTATQNLWFSWSTSHAKTFADVRKRQTIIASSGRGVTAYMPRALNKLAGAKFKIVTGYRGSRDVALALERGEVEVGYGLWSWVKATKKDWIEKKMITPLFLSGDRLADLPDVLSTTDLGLSQESQDILRHLGSTTAVGRSMLTTPNVPADRVRMLRRSFAALFKDPAFLATAAKRKMELNSLSGEKLQKIIANVVATPEALAKKLRAAVKATGKSASRKSAK
jgi:tripartite-type tricarboxylate transporter receptor subunit TctC